MVSHPMMRRAAMLPVAMACHLAATTAVADDVQLLGTTHAEIGLPCGACHVETPPSVAVETAICVSCHGLNADVAELTVEIEPNPHASHKGELECSSCHRVHTQSVDACIQCHDWGYDIP